jgi:hypothetical protein
LGGALCLKCLVSYGQVESTLRDSVAWRTIRLIWRNPFLPYGRDTRLTLVYGQSAYREYPH